MGLPKGRTNNVSGRKKGVPNKIGRDAKQLIADFVQEKMIEMWQLWHKLSPHEKTALLINLAPYVVPKMAAMAISAELNFKEMAESDLDRIANKLYNYGKNKE